MKTLFRKPLVLHPFLLGTYFILEGFASIADYVPLFALVPPFFLLLLITFCSYYLVRLLVKDKIKSGIVTSIISIPILFFAKIVDIFSNSFFGIGWVRYIVLALVVLMVIFIWLVLRNKRKFGYFNSALNWLAACYVVYGAFLVAVNAKPYDNTIDAKLLKHQADVSGVSPARSEGLPDIYYIILDGYGGSGSLAKYFNYDNSGFTGALEKHGFYVAQESRSASIDTLSSLVSSLNFYYDPELMDNPEEVLCSIVNKNRATTFLRSQNYEIINLSFLKIGDTSRFYRAFTIGKEGPLNFHGLFFRTAIIDIMSHVRANKLYKVNLDIFSRLEKIALAKKVKPVFVYAHLMTPHVPYCFDRNGNIIPWWKRKQESDKQAYLEQLIYTNKKVLEVVDTLLSAQPKQPIIVIQGDHGFRQIEGDDFEDASTSILNAYYFPGGGKDLLYPSIGPFNTFRVIFNYYFGTSYELLKEEKQGEGV